MKQGTLPENAPRRRKPVLGSWVCNRSNGVVEVRTFSWGVELGHVMEKREIVINWEWIKLASLVLIWILWVVTLWRRILAILRIWEIWSMEDLYILRVVVPCNELRTKWIRVLSRYVWCPKSMWDEVGDRQLFGPNVIKESEENVKLIRDRLKVAQSRQKSYVDSKTQGGSLWNWR